MGQKVLITGGTGYIGSATVKAAVEDDLEVIALTRSKENAVNLEQENIRTVVGDLYQDGEWQSIIKEVDYAVFLASPPTWGKKVTKKVAQNFQQGHEKMTKRFLDACVGSDLKKIVYIAGTSYFGDSGDKEPQKEEMAADPKGWGPYIAPSVELIPEYVSKGLPIITAFPGQVYGPDSWMPQLYLNNIYEEKPVTGLKGYNPVMSTIHVEDCGRAILHLAISGNAGERYLLVDDQPIPSADLCNYIGEVMNKQVQTRKVPKWLCNLLLGPVLTEYATAHTNFSNKKLKETGFTFHYPTYKDGVPNVVESWISQKQSS
ncbi:NAD(P)-dependent oxidoreductase [Evansella sp. AB-P1]|uniref:NAD-dependent epimerase/dehydratase family protein n=1 Tax=Evansella sp. AB-P1 TaxID=3037653 RepID=UPI00241DBFE0|nr:NAD(P)-dependent oxidoreductase [Evansella sp. AB-P1]MDG5785971.1 NAD(P)-dependent oxidoreductase [Evansella sp. AB-P1]